MAEAMRYRSRVVEEFDALRWTGGNIDAVQSFLGCNVQIGDANRIFWGSRFASVGDYLAKDADGFVEAVAPGEFTRLYEPCLPQQDQPEVAIEQGGDAVDAGGKGSSSPDRGDVAGAGVAIEGDPGLAKKLQEADELVEWLVSRTHLAEEHVSEFAKRWGELDIKAALSWTCEHCGEATTVLGYDPHHRTRVVTCGCTSTQQSTTGKEDCEPDEDERFAEAERERHEAQAETLADWEREAAEEDE